MSSRGKWQARPLTRELPVALPTQLHVCNAPGVAMPRSVTTRSPTIVGPVEADIPAATRGHQRPKDQDDGSCQLLVTAALAERASRSEPKLCFARCRNGLVAVE